MKRIAICLALLLALLLTACKDEAPVPTTTAGPTQPVETTSEPLELPETEPSSGIKETEKPTEPPCTHEWVLDETRPHTATCTEAGQEFYVCTLCGFAEARDKAAVGHSWATITLVSGDCESGMTYHQRCRSCGWERDITTKPGEHQPDWENHGRTQAPTCTEQGFTYAYCIGCGERFVEYTEPLGHTYADGACTVCGAAQPEDAEPEETPETTEPAPTSEAAEPTT